MSQFWSAAQLAIFAKVVDLNGFSAAARAFGVPKAAVSRAVADLERTLGVRLLERTTRRIALTAAGRLIYPHAERILLESEAVRAQAQKLGARSEGPLRVTADPTYGRVLLAPLVPRFLERFPQTPLEVALEAAPAGGEWDVAIRVGGNDDPEHVCRELGAPPSVLCATPAYLGGPHGVPQRPEDLPSHVLLVPESADGSARELRLELRRASQRAEVRLVPKLAVNDPAVIHASTAAGLGIGLLPEFLCRQGLATGKLRRVLQEWSLPPCAPICAVCPVALDGDPRVREFVDFLAANLVPALAAGGAD